jgi:hypothetical protein
MGGTHSETVGFPLMDKQHVTRGNRFWDKPPSNQLDDI